MPPEPINQDPVRTGRGWQRRLRPTSVGSGFRRELVVFLGVALLTLLVVAGGTYLLSGKIARDTALEDAETLAERMARFIVEPLLHTGFGSPEERDDLRRIFDSRIADGSVTAAFIWNAEGTIVWGTDQSREGDAVDVSGLLREALDGEVVSDIEEESEVGGYAAREPQLEVYAPLDVLGERHALEVYFDTSMIERDAATLRGQFVPLAVGALVVLQLMQIPIVVSLGRRLRQNEAERTGLVRRHLAASESERRAIAADVHDGPVQDLAGVSYALSALRPSVAEPQRPTVDRMVTAVRNAVASLRRLMVDIYPPDLSGAGLTTALHDLATPLRERGVAVDVRADDAPPIPDVMAPVLYRTAKEALTNVARHSQAEHVTIELQRAVCDDGSPGVRLTVTDDGVGFPPPDAERDGMVDRPPGGDGHLGLRAMNDRVVEAGGTLSLGNGKEKGAVLTAVVPLDSGQ